MNAVVRSGERFLQRVKSWWNSGEEGSWRGPFYGQGHLGHWFELGRLEDGFQRDLRVPRWGIHTVPVIAALRHLHRSAFAQLRPHHMYEDNRGVIEDLANTAQLRVMLRPNSYESGPDFSARLADEWMTTGEVLVWGIRNDRSEVDQMHIVPRGSWRLVVDPQTQEYFYAVTRSDNDLLRTMDDGFVVPERDVMHLRWATPRHPLIGESGFAAAGLAAGIQVALSESQAAFFSQMRRPSGVLSTDQQLTKEQILRLREAYDMQAKGMAQGGVPILASGLKWQQMSISSEDAEVIAALRMSNEEIARCVGVPGPLIGDLEKSGLTNTEALIEFWLSVSLGGLIERYEAGLNRLLGLDGRRDWVDMSTEALLRTNLVQRMEGLTKGVQGGVLSPNEARKREGLSPVSGGDQVFLQRQNTPVNLLGELAAADLERKDGPAPPAIEDDDADEEDAPAQDRSLELAMRAQVAEALLQIEHRAAALESAAATQRAQVADILRSLEQRVAAVKDGVDGTGIAALAQSEDLTTLEIEFTNGERHEIRLPAGAPGEQGECGLAGRDGIGLDAPGWTSGVHREGTVVQHYEGRSYRALQDTADEPGDSAHWQRIGLHGQRWCGPVDAQREYEAGDLYVDGGTFLVLASGARRCLAPKPLAPSDVRSICGHEIEHMQAMVGKEFERGHARITALADSIENLLSVIEASTQAVANVRADINTLAPMMQELRLEMDVLSARKDGGQR